MNYQRSICWIRRDLRLRDHTALSSAIRQSEKVFIVFVFDTNILGKLADKDDKRLSFIAGSLRDLDQTLRTKGSALIVRHGDPVEEIPRLAVQLKADALFTNRDYEPYARHRDEKVQTQLESERIAFHSFKDQVIFEHPQITTGQGTPYKVFTPYKKAWLARLQASDYKEHPCRLKRLASLKLCREHLWKWSLKEIGFDESSLWLEPGEQAARKRLRRFKPFVNDYEHNRNFPSIRDGTSGLSAHLRFGTISIRELVRFAMNQKSNGAQVWLSELVWRDFYQMILSCFPHVTKGSFKPEYDNIRWPGSTHHFKLWCEGNTGFPLVDAAMRHFYRTGWMHNRLRMIVASFLTKDLLVDWRKGEAWFARKLLDFDLAANNGGWQWCASTGCDAQPWFRVFNPVTQSKKFDPDGDFIRTELPELAGFSNRRIHWPHDAKIEEQQKAVCILGKHYPHAIVDHSDQREKAIRLFKQAG